MDALEAGIIGLILPPVVSLLKNVAWPDKLKFALSVVISFVAVAVVNAVRGQFHSWQDFIGQSATTWATSQVVYQLYFGDTSVNTALESVNVLPAFGNK